MQRDRPDILVIPPLAWGFFLVAATLLGRWLPLAVLPGFPWWPGLIAGALMIVFALYTNISGARAFMRSGTSINPYRPTLSIVRDGAFRYTRNPMYLGMVLLIIGYGLAASNLWGILCAVALWSVLHFGVVLQEERYLTAKFGDDYRALLIATRRWL